jgi:hypothetical protein
VRDTPLWLRVVAGSAVLGMVIAVTKPPVAPLVLRAMVVAATVALAVLTVHLALRDVEPADALGRRPDPKDPGDVPRELAQLTDELRSTRRRDPLPSSVTRSLRTAFQHRLWYRHGLSTTIPEHHAAIQQQVSPTAWALLLSTHTDRDPIRIPAAGLPALIDEVEHL